MLKLWERHSRVAQSYLVLLLTLIMIFSSIGLTYAAEADEYKQGFEFGETYKDEIISNIEEMKEMADANNTYTSNIEAECKEAQAFYETYLPEKVQWMKGIADSTGISYMDIFIFNTFNKRFIGFEGECTTLMAQGNALASGKGTIIMKNRDQGATCLSEISIVQEATYPKNSIYQAAYIDIPQVEKTNKFIGSRTAGRWGYGMGINEYQVIVADNDAPSRDYMDWKEGLHDNDVVRLVLERAKTAREGVDIVTNLVEKYGQAWNGIIFEIGDPNELWLVEVTGHRWVAKKYTDTVTARSNQYQIEDDYDFCSEDLIDFAVEQGWVDEGVEKINFRKVYSCDQGYPYDNNLDNRKNVEKMYNTEIRYQRGMELLNKDTGNITIQTIMKAARDHFDTYVLPSGTEIELNQVPFYSSKYQNWVGKEFLKEEPEQDQVSAHMYVRGVCSHDVGWGRTVASGLLYARPDVPNELGLMLHTFSPPCNSVYIPFYAGISQLHPDFNEPEAAVLFQSIATRAFGFYTMYHEAIREVFDAYEEEMLQELTEFEEEYMASYEADETKADESMNQFVMDKCSEALAAASAVQDAMTETAYKRYAWIEREPVDHTLKIYMDDILISFPDEKPFIDENNRTQVPIRAIGEAIGFQIGFKTESGQSIVTIEKAGKKIELYINQLYAVIDGETIEMDTAPIIKNGRTMIPLRFIAEHLGIDTHFDSTSNSVIMTINQ